ncbi:MAG: hypothetical protein AAGJ46_08590 [Planctomycetota bacterium]
MKQARRPLHDRAFPLLAACMLLAFGDAFADAAEPAWIDQRQVGPFAVRSQFSLVGQESLLKELIDLEQELRRVLALRPCTDVLTVNLYAAESGYRAMLAEQFPGVPFRRALYVQRGGSAQVYAYRHEELAVDLRHECTHALLHADLAMLPLWLDEGLAEYFEMPAASRAFGNPHAESLKMRMRLRMVRSLDSLEKEHELAGMTARDYQYAWLWTHFLLHGPKPATEQLWAFLSSVRRGEPPGDLSDRLAGVFASPSASVVRHYWGWQKLAAASSARR